VMGRVRQLAVGVARDYLHQQEIESGKLPKQETANA
jgi:hypothetical protein